MVTLIVKRDLSKYLGMLGEADSDELEELEGEVYDLSSLDPLRNILGCSP